MFDKSENGKWVRQDPVVDSGAVECVSSRKRMPHLRVERRGDRQLADLGTVKRGVFKVGLISVDRLQETGHDALIMPLRKDGGMFVLDTWIWVPTSRSKTESCSTQQRYVCGMKAS